jgi:hypothetical protein
MKDEVMIGLKLLMNGRESVSGVNFIFSPSLEAI